MSATPLPIAADACEQGTDLQTRRQWTRLTPHRALSRRQELTYAFVLPLIAATALYGRHVIAGGRYLDDWWLGMYSLFPHSFGFGSAYGYLNFYSGSRPGAVLYWLVTYKLFALHDVWHRALSLALGAFLTSVFYLLLRELRLARRDAAAIALLSLALPVADAIHFWITPAVAQLGLAACAGGLLVALRGLSASGAPAVRRHALALGLYAVSLLIAETTLPLIGLTLLLYRTRVGWRAAARRWTADLLLAGVAALHYAATAPPRLAASSGSLSYVVSHAEVLADQALTLFTATLVPIAHSRILVLVGLFILAALLAVEVTRADSAGPQRAEVRRWVVVAALAFVLGAASYVVYLPSDASYQPLAPGVGNRVNIGALLPLSVLVFATVRALSGLLGTGWRSSVATAAAFTVILVGAVVRVEADQALWDAAGSHQVSVLSALHRALPDPPTGSSMLVLGAPGVVTHFERVGESEINVPIPVFSTWWELDAAVRLSYGRADLSAYPIWAYQPAQLVCGAYDVYQLGLDGVRHALAYDHVYVVDVRQAKAIRLDSQRGCKRVLAQQSTVRYDLPVR